MENAGYHLRIKIAASVIAKRLLPWIGVWTIPQVWSLVWIVKSWWIKSRNLDDFLWPAWTLLASYFWMLEADLTRMWKRNSEGWRALYYDLKGMRKWYDLGDQMATSIQSTHKTESDGGRNGRGEAGH